MFLQKCWQYISKISNTPEFQSYMMNHQYSSILPLLNNISMVIGTGTAEPSEWDVRIENKFAEIFDDSDGWDVRFDVDANGKVTGKFIGRLCNTTAEVVTITEAGLRKKHYLRQDDPYSAEYYLLTHDLFNEYVTLQPGQWATIRYEVSL